MGLAAGDSYPSEQAAAVAALNEIYPPSINENREYGGRLYRKWFGFGAWTYTPPKKMGEGSGNLPKCFFSCGPGYHSHGGNDPRYDGENFSPADVSWAEDNGENLWLITPKHYIGVYMPGEDGKPGHVKVVPQQKAGDKNGRSGNGSRGNKGQSKSGSKHVCTGSRIPTTNSCTSF